MSGTMEQMAITDSDIILQIVSTITFRHIVAVSHKSTNIISLILLICLFKHICFRRLQQCCRL